MALVAMLLLAGCSTTPPAGLGAAPGPGSWARTAAPTPSVSFGWQAGAVTYLATGLGVYSTTDDGNWTAHLGPEPGVSNPVRRTFRQQLVLPDRTLVVGSEADRPAVWFADARDRPWPEATHGGLGTKGEIASVAATSAGVVAVGRAPSDGQGGSMGPALWRSWDQGETWTRLPVGGDAFGPATSLFRVVSLGPRVAVAGERDGRSRVWATNDLRDWDDITGEISADATLAGNGTSVVALGRSADPRHTGHDPVGWVTTDLRTWQPIPPDPTVFGDTGLPGPDAPVFWTPVAVSDGRFTITGTAPQRSDPQFCFQELATCQQLIDYVATSADGLRWQRLVEADRDDTDQAGPFVAVVQDSVPVAVVQDATGQRLWRWSTPDTAPRAPDRPVPTTTTPALPILDAEHPDLAVGASARVLWDPNGCNASGLTLGDRPWVIETGGRLPLDPAWPTVDGPSPRVLGTLTRSAPDEATFTVEGTDTTVRLVPDPAPAAAACL